MNIFKPVKLRGYSMAPTAIKTYIPTESDGHQDSFSEIDMEFQLQEANRLTAKLQDEVVSLQTERASMKHQLQLTSERENQLNQYVEELKTAAEDMNDKMHVMGDSTETLLRIRDLEKQNWTILNGIAFLQERAKAEDVTLAELQGGIASFDFDTRDHDDITVNTFEVRSLREEITKLKEKIIPDREFEKLANRLIEVVDQRKAGEGHESVPVEKYKHLKEKYKAKSYQLSAMKQTNSDLDAELERAGAHMCRLEASSAGVAQLSAERDMLLSELDSLKKTVVYYESEMTELQVKVDYLSELKGYYKENDSAKLQTTRKRLKMKYTKAAQKEAQKAAKAENEG